jgi:hypothetical protein
MKTKRYNDIQISLQQVRDNQVGPNSELLQMDYTSAVCLGHFSDEELRQLESELELSQVIQRGLLPQRVPSIEGMNLAAFNRPAQLVGGDYFDFVDFKDGKHGLVMADVSGHGVSAGMFMSSLQTAFHTLVPEADSPLDVLERINRLYYHLLWQIRSANAHTELCQCGTQFCLFASRCDRSGNLAASNRSSNWFERGIYHL